MNWTWSFHTLGVRLSTIVIYFIKTLNWSWHFHNRVWNLPQLLFLLLKLWIETDAFTPRNEIFHGYDFFCWSFEFNMTLSHCRCELALMFSVEASNWTWHFHTDHVKCSTAMISLLKLQIEPHAFTPRVQKKPHNYDFICWNLKLLNEPNSFTP